MEIRKMTLADYPMAYALWDSAPGMGLRALDDSEAGIGRFLRRNPLSCFVAEDEGQVIGTILAGHDGRRGSIYHLLVRPDARRKGLGRALVKEALAALRREGILKVSLVVFSDNRDGNAFWEGLGFEARKDLCYRNLSLDPENT